MEIIVWVAVAIAISLVLGSICYVNAKKNNIERDKRLNEKMSYSNDLRSYVELRNLKFEDIDRANILDTQDISGPRFNFKKERDKEYKKRLS